MKERNILTNIKITITNEDITNSDDYTTIFNKLEDSLSQFEYVYSYIIYSKYKKVNLVSTFDEFVITINISQTSEYNTLDVSKVCDDIFNKLYDEITRSSETYVIGYQQPPLNIIVQIYEPLVKNLATKMFTRWSGLRLEYEDLFQDCYIVLIDLYNKGYYIHKSLLEKSYNNYILMKLRGYRGMPDILSLNAPVINTDDKMIMLDTVADVKQEEEMETVLNDDFGFIVELSNIIKDMIGERQYTQLLNEYKTRNTTNWGRNKVHQLRKQIRKLNLDKYYKE